MANTKIVSNGTLAQPWYANTHLGVWPYLPWRKTHSLRANTIMLVNKLAAQGMATVKAHWAKG